MVSRLPYVLLLFPLFIAGATNAYDAALARGAELLLPFKKELKSALLEGLEQGPVEALSVCQLRAPEIAVSRAHEGIRVGRSSHRLRNPANSSPEWVLTAMQAYLDDDRNRAPYVVPLSGDRWGYAEPIIAQPLCLTCHGKVLSPAVAERIDELYPADRAVGFEAGDLRGVFWLEFPMTGNDGEKKY